MPETTAAVDRAAADIPLTRSARDVLESAVEQASKRSEPDATPMDVLRSVLSARGSLADETMRQLGVDPAALLTRLPQDGAQPTLPLRQLVVNANREAQVLGHYQVDSIHLLLALLYSDSRATSAALQSAGLTLYDLRRHMQTGAGTNAPVEATSSRRTPDRALRRRPWPSLLPVLGVSPLFGALVAVVAVAGGLLWFGVLPDAAPILTLVFVVVGWVVSVCVHEFFHAAVAYVGGDRDVAASGYLTLNPLRYTNVVMSLVFPVVALLLGGFALPGGAVYIKPGALRTRLWDSVVSLAGPVANALLALVIAGVISLAFHFEWITGANLSFFAALGYLGFVQVFAVILNLLPIPPLDGFGILRPWLPYGIQSAAAHIGMAGFVVVFLVLWYVPFVAGALSDATRSISDVIGIDPYLVFIGQQHMRFR